MMKIVCMPPPAVSENSVRRHDSDFAAAANGGSHKRERRLDNQAPALFVNWKRGG
jgi:hypothetical protein